MSGRQGPLPARLLGAVTAGLVLLAGCGTSTAPATGRAGACGAVQRPAIQSGSHLLGDRAPPVPYNSVPPTSGWHSSAPPPEGFHDASEPLSEPQQVTVLEVGGIVVTYHGLPPEDVDELRGIVAAAGGKVVATAYDRLDPGAVAFTAWGALQRCDGVDAIALAAFVDAYHGVGADG